MIPQEFNIIIQFACGAEQLTRISTERQIEGNMLLGSVSMWLGYCGSHAYSACFN